MRSTVSEHFLVKASAHAGLALNRLIATRKNGESDADQKKRQQNEMLESTKILPCSAYEEAFKIWEKAQAELGSHIFSATTSGPLAIGLGNASPYEVGLTLHHIYGIPYLPGSALKGLARRAARDHGITEDSIEFKILFGDKKQASYITWWDGWLEVSSSTKPLQIDTITVHHPEYYQGKGGWPTDFDDPTPIPFLSMQSNLTFRLALSGPIEWSYFAARLLDYGLTHLGLGAKTNSGYGYFEVKREKQEAELEQESKALKEKEEQALKKQIEEGSKALKEKAEKALKEQVEKDKRRLEDRVKQIRSRIVNIKPKNATVEVGNLLQLSKDTPIKTMKELLQELYEFIESDKNLNDRKLLQKIKTALEGDV